MKKRFSNSVYVLFAMLSMAWVIHFIYPIYYSISSGQAKEEQRQYIENHPNSSSYIKLSLTDKTFNNSYNAEEKELSVNGEKYDVVKVTKDKNIVVCTVLPDHEETNLDHDLATHYNHEKEVKNIKPLLLWSPVTLGSPKITLHINHFIKNSSLFHSYNYVPLLNGHLRAMIKPPQIV